MNLNHEPLDNPSISPSDGLLGDFAPYLRLLAPDDRQIMELLLPGLITVRGVAVLLHKNPGAVSRKAALIRNRLNHPVARAIVLAGGELAPTPLRVAKAHFMAGKPPTTVARDLGISVERVLSLIKTIRAWAFKHAKNRNDTFDIFFT